MGHRCKNRELKVVLVQEGDCIEDDRSELLEEPSVEVAELVERELNSIVGLTTSRTMKIKGTVQLKVVVILIDCRVTHHLISPTSY